MSGISIQESREEQLMLELEETNIALKNVADAVASGLISDVLIAKLNELESKKVNLEQRLADNKHMEMNVSVDTDLTLSEYAEVRNSPSLPEYKTFVGNFIEKIEGGKYIVNITLKTGLGIYPELDTTLDVRRQEIYEYKKNY